MSKGKCLAIVIMSGGTNWFGAQFDEKTPGIMHKTPIFHYFIDAAKIAIDMVDNWPATPGTDLEIIKLSLGQPGVEEAINNEIKKIQNQIQQWEQEKTGNFLAHILIRCRGGFQRSVVIATVIAEKLKEAGYKVILHHATMALAMQIKKEVFNLG